jgi:hypothetical protein
VKPPTRGVRSVAAPLTATHRATWICNTPCPKLLIWPSSACEMGLHTHRTSLTLLSLLRIKRLTQRCYVWNDKAYELALTLLNFQGGTKPTNNNSTCATWATWTNFTTTTRVCRPIPHVERGHISSFGRGVLWDHNHTDCTMVSHAILLCTHLRPRRRSRSGGPRSLTWMARWPDLRPCGLVSTVQTFVLLHLE